MKTTLITIFLLCINLLLFSQEQKCKSLHKGMFRLVSGDTTIIKRTKSRQIEKNSSLGVKLIYDVTWIDDCTYELRARRLVKGAADFAPRKGDVITVHIKVLKVNSYISESTSNYSDLIMVSEIEIL